MKQKLFVFVVLFILNTNLFGQRQRGYENKDVANNPSTNGESRENTTLKPFDNRELETKIRAERLKREEREKKERAQRRKTRDKYERKAENQIEKERRNREKEEKEIREARMKANLIGCSLSSVYVNPKSQKRYRAKTIRISNNSSEFISITSTRGGDGILIGNLCPKGSVSISLIYNGDSDYYYNSSQNFELIAAGYNFKRIFNVSINRYGNNDYSPFWEISDNR
jgi:flagellar biosynthesis GTPase FlhF